MPLQTKRLCSILGTSLIGLCLIAGPAFAQKKGKKSDEAAAQEEPASVDALMEDATKEKAKPAEKKGKKGKKGKKDEEPELSPEEKKAAEEKAAEDQKAAEELAATDEWERPPEDEKPAQAQAKAPVVEETSGDGRQISIGLLLGWGFKTDRSTSSLGADPYGPMAKLRGGYTWDFMLYTGVFFTYYLGSSNSGGGRTIGTSTTHASSMNFGVDVGYDWFVGPVILRPSLELGLAYGFTDKDGPTTSKSSLFLGPGLLLMYPFDDWFIGGDLRGNIVTGDGVSGFAAAITGGLRF